MRLRACPRPDHRADRDREHGRDLGIGHVLDRDEEQPDAKDSASTKDFKAADRAMMKDMDLPDTGDPDVDFRTHMIPHHRGAVAMAKVALKHAKEPATKAMAQKIIDDQEKEISDMEAWLKRHGK